MIATQAYTVIREVPESQTGGESLMTKARDDRVLVIVSTKGGSGSSVVYSPRKSDMSIRSLRDLRSGGSLFKDA
jgi:hypothetical protein